MMLFLVGILEMFIATLWTKTVSETKIISSGVITFINILIWYYVLQAIVDNIYNWQLVLLYALGCAIGAMFTTYFYQLKEQRAKKRKK